MMIVGPSYSLNNRKADVQRSVNLFPVVMETPGGKSFAYLDSVPGLREFSRPPLGMTYFLLLESGGYLLQQSGGRIELE
jgi:hypothetical protein